MKKGGVHVVIEVGFNEEQQEALALLFEQYWILRDKDPVSYQLIRENEKALKRYLSEKLGYFFVVHKDFIKLEIVPVMPKNWMGIQSFQHPRDYALFSCGLAYIESRSVDDQFLLSELTEELSELYPGMFALDWTNYSHRQSLVRVLRQLVDLNLIKEIDSETDGLEGFARNESQEILFQTTIYARYYMRTHMRSLTETKSIQDILALDWERNQENQRRKRVYRRLFLEPVIYRESEEDWDFDYIRRYRNRIREDIEEHTPYELYVTKNMAMLTLSESKQSFTSFPDRKAISSICLHIQAEIREHLDDFSVTPFGEIRLTRPEFEQIVASVREKQGHGWSIEYREKSSLQKIAEDALTHFIEWSFVVIEEDTELIVLKPAMSRMIGEYPTDFERKEEE